MIYLSARRVGSNILSSELFYLDADLLFDIAAGYRSLRARQTLDSGISRGRRRDDDQSTTTGLRGPDGVHASTQGSLRRDNLLFLGFLARKCPLYGGRRWH